MHREIPIQLQTPLLQSRPALPAVHIDERPLLVAEHRGLTVQCTAPKHQCGELPPVLTVIHCDPPR